MFENLKIKSGDLNFAPDYGGVNWRAMLLSRLGIESPTGAGMWLELGELKIELTQRNCVVEMNGTDDRMDNLQIEDPRDGKSWTIFRGEFGEEDFDAMLPMLQYSATVVHTPFPSEQTVAVFLQREDEQIAQSLELLEGGGDSSQVSGF